MEFYTILSKYYHHIFPANPKEKSLLDFHIIDKKSAALDIGCGLGNTASYLTTHFTNVLGIDLNFAMVQKAKESYPNIQFMTLDMKQLDKLSPTTFDAVTCFGNTLVHVSNEDAQHVLQKISKVANRGAHMFIQIINYDRIYKDNITSLPLIDNEYVSMQRSYKLYDDHLIFTSTILDKDTSETATQSITLYPLLHKQLTSMIEHAGFEVKDSYASFDQVPWHQDGYATIIHAIKKD